MDEIHAENDNENDNLYVDLCYPLIGRDLDSENRKIYIPAKVIIQKKTQPKPIQHQQQQNVIQEQPKPIQLQQQQDLIQEQQNPIEHQQQQEQIQQQQQNSVQELKHQHRFTRIMRRVTSLFHFELLGRAWWSN